MASFPTSVKSFSARTSGETIAASHINDLQDEVAAIEADLLSATPTYITKATTGVNASALSTGTLPIARLDANVLLTTSTTGMNASALSTGTVPDARLSGTYTLITANNATFAFGKSEGALNVNSATTATTANNSTYAFGKSEGALNVNSAATATQTTNATNLNSQPGSYYTNASNLATGTLAIARLDANVILTTSTTGMNASAVSTGTLPDARLSSNVALLNATNVFTASAAFPLTLQPSTATSYAVMAMTNTGGSGYIGQNGSTAGAFLVDGTAYALFMRAPSGVPIEFGSGTTKNMTLSSAGLLTVSGSGFSAFDADSNGLQGLDVRNDTTGTAAGSMLRLWSDSNDSLTVSSFSTSHSTHAGKSRINQNTAAGLDIIASHASGDIRLYSRNALALTLGASQLATFTGNIRMTSGYTISWSSDDYRIFRNGDTLRFDQAGVQALLFSGSQAATFAGTLAWGGGSAISSSSNVALLNAASVTWTGLGGTSSLLFDAVSNYNIVSLNNTATFAGGLGMAGGAAGDTGALYFLTPSGGEFQWRINNATQMSISSAGLLAVNGFGTHSFSAGGTGGNTLYVGNTSDGTGNYGRIFVDSNASTGGQATLDAFSASYTTSGSSVASGATLTSWRGGGLSLSAAHASGDVRIYSRNALALTLGASQAATFTNTLAWGGGSAISSSNNVALLNAANVFTAGTQSIRPSASNVELQLDASSSSYYAQLTYRQGATYTWNVYANTGATPDLIWASGSGGDVRMRLSAAGLLTVTGDVSLAATKKLYLDGGSDTYITESSGNNISVYCGGADRGGFNTAGVYVNTYPTTVLAANLWSQNGSNIHISTSSIKYKHDIETLDAAHARAAVMAMRPVTYRGKMDEDQRRVVGFIAEEMQQIAPLLCTYDEGGESGTPNYVTYDRVTAYLVAVVQKQQAEIDALKAQIKG